LTGRQTAHGVDPADLSESGLGYANLLFIATVVPESRNTKDADPTLVLVEKSEAHLDPRLRTVLLGDPAARRENGVGTSGIVGTVRGSTRCGRRWRSAVSTGIRCGCLRNRVP
jgi:hypothetical protein